MDAVIGHTGFVGQHLCQQHRFDGGYNSATVDSISGATFDTLVCAAAPGSMVEANNQPDRDRARIDALIERLRSVSARRFILISSIAVLRDFAGGDDEDTRDFQVELAYGRHRRLLEEACAAHFPHCLTVRLPALFGTGLKKNFLFDLLNPLPTMLPAARLAALRDVLPAALAPALNTLYAPDAQTGMLRVDRAALAARPDRTALEQAVTDAGFAAVQFHHPETTYQYYDMRRLWTDIGVALDAGLDTIHLATEPQTTDRIHRRLLGRPMPQTGARLHREEMRTRHAALWDRSGTYLQDADSVLDALAGFFAGERGVVA